MSRTIQQKMHAQHRQWENDYRVWRADLGRWSKQLRAALSDVREVEEALRDALDALGVHADGMWENEQRRRAHELVLSEEAKSGTRKTDRAWAKTHHQLAARHERMVDVHARIRAHQRALLAEVARLARVARKAM